MVGMCFCISRLKSTRPSRHTCLITCSALNLTVWCLFLTREMRKSCTLEHVS
jgi:hypothetical protein